MKSIKQQYIDLKEGKMSQHNFMRNLRMTMPQHVTNVTSFGDAVRILKNKGILTEVYEGDGTIKYVESQLNYMVDGDSITFDEFKAAMSYLKDHSEEIVKEFGNNVSLEDATKIAKTIVDTATNKSLTEAKEKMPKGNSGKELYAKFEKEVPANFQEMMTGIAIEHECYPEKTYDEVVKLVTKNLKKQPNYYTNWKLSGVEGKEPKIIGDVKPEERKMKFTKDDNIADKAMSTKQVKGFEKAKASANKAKKETNSMVKGVEEFSLTAKTVRGVKKMDSTGEKMKKIVMKEGNSLTEEDIIKMVHEIMSK